MTATVSVIMPVLNGERYVAESLRSALDQLHGDDEILVVDNGSTDATLDRVAAVSDGRVRVLHQGVRGPSAARNLGLAAASRDFVAFLDHDDLWPAGRQEGLLATLEANTEAGAAYGRLFFQFDAGVDASKLPFDGQLLDTYVLGPFLFRRSAMARLGLFDESLMFGEDLDFLLRLTRTGTSVVAWDGPALIYRQHDGNMTQNRPAAEQGLWTNLHRQIAHRRSLARGKGKPE